MSQYNIVTKLLRNNKPQYKWSATLTTKDQKIVETRRTEKQAIAAVVRRLYED